MLSGDFISHEIPALKLSDSIKQVLIWMDEHHVLHLPVFAAGLYQGVISESDLLSHQNTEDDLSTVQDRFLRYLCPMTNLSMMSSRPWMIIS